MITRSRVLLFVLLGALCLPLGTQAQIFQVRDISILRIVTSLLPEGTVDKSYSVQLEARGGVKPYKWAVVRGSLPKGIALSSNGLLSGVPTEEGKSNFKVVVKDQSGQRSAKVFSILVYPPLSIATESLPFGEFGVPYQEQLQAEGGKSPYTWALSSGELPEGVELSESGSIAGVPTKFGDFQFTVAVQDEIGNADSSEFVLVVPAPSGGIYTVAGDGTFGPSLGGVDATTSPLSSPSGIAVDQYGNLYFTEQNLGVGNKVHKVDAQTGVMTTIAGTGQAGFSGDGGPAIQAALDDPRGVAVDDLGNIYIADAGNSRVRRVDANGMISTVAGPGIFPSILGDGGPATEAYLAFPVAVECDHSGGYYIVDRDDSRVRRVDSQGIISTFAGDGIGGYSGFGGPAIEAGLELPEDLAIDSFGNIYISVWAAILRVDVNSGILTSYAGTGNFGYTGDGGIATDATMDRASGLAFDSADNLYICESHNRVVRVIEKNSQFIYTVAGDGTYGYGGDGGLAGNAILSYVNGLGIDSGGNLYVADSDNSRIRKIVEPEVPAPPPTPKIVNLSPSLNQSDVDRDTNISATFDSSMVFPSVDELVVGSQFSGKTTGSYSQPTPSEFLFSPSTAFHAGEKVEVVLTTQIQNLEGDSLRFPFVYRFQVRVEGSGTGSFVPFSAFPTTSTSAYAIEFADMDGDLDLDMVVANWGQQSRVYLNDSAGNFTAGPPFGTGVEEFQSLAVGDFDGDGDVDIAVGGYQSQNYVYLNDGSGNLNWPGSSRLFGNGADWTDNIEVGDMNGDGYTDLVVGNNPGSTVVHLNDGSGNFDWAGSESVAYYGAARDISVNDMDGDGSLDVIVVRPQASTVCLNNGSAVFHSFNQRPFGSASTIPSSLVTGDVDGDGDNDAIVCNHSSPISVLLNNGDGILAESGLFDGAYDETAQSKLVDVDSDGDLDLVTSQRFSEGKVFTNDGSGSFALHSSFGSSSEVALSLALADVDGDNDLDIARGNSWSANAITIYTNE